MSIKARTVRVEIGDIPKVKEEGVIYFSNFEEMNKVLTPNRVDILNAIKKYNPKSIYELATILGKDQGNITKDVNILSESGFIEIKQTTEGKRKKSEPKVEMETIEMVIKLGAGAFGIAKDVFDDVSQEFKDDKLEKNKEFIKNKSKPIRNVVKKVSKVFDDLLKEED